MFHTKKFFLMKQVKLNTSFICYTKYESFWATLNTNLIKKTQVTS